MIFILSMVMWSAGTYVACYLNYRRGFQRGMNMGVKMTADRLVPLMRAGGITWDDVKGALCDCETCDDADQVPN